MMRNILIIIILLICLTIPMITSAYFINTPARNVNFLETSATSVIGYTESPNNNIEVYILYQCGGTSAKIARINKITQEIMNTVILFMPFDSASYTSIKAIDDKIFVAGSCGNYLDPNDEIIYLLSTRPFLVELESDLTHIRIKTASTTINPWEVELSPIITTIDNDGNMYVMFKRDIETDRTFYIRKYRNGSRSITVGWEKTVSSPRGVVVPVSHDMIFTNGYLYTGFIYEYHHTKYYYLNTYTDDGERIETIIRSLDKDYSGLKLNTDGGRIAVAFHDSVLGDQPAGYGLDILYWDMSFISRYNYTPANVYLTHVKRPVIFENDIYLAALKVYADENKLDLICLDGNGHVMRKIDNVATSALSSISFLLQTYFKPGTHIDNRVIDQQKLALIYLKNSFSYWRDYWIPRTVNKGVVIFPENTSICLPVYNAYICPDSFGDDTAIESFDCDSNCSCDMHLLLQNEFMENGLGYIAQNPHNAGQLINGKEILYYEWPASSCAHFISGGSYPGFIVDQYGNDVILDYIENGETKMLYSGPTSHGVGYRVMQHNFNLIYQANQELIE